MMVVSWTLVAKLMVKNRLDLVQNLVETFGFGCEKNDASNDCVGRSNIIY